MITSEQIAQFLGAPLHGGSREVRHPRSLGNADAFALIFANRFSPERVAQCNQSGAALALVIPEYHEAGLSVPHVVLANPRLAFARVVARYFAPRPSAGIARTAVLGQGVVVGENVSVGEFAVIGDGVVLGADTVVRHHAVISSGTRIGARSLVKSHAVIGEEGFGFEYDENGAPVRLPHLGGVRIGDDVEIGAGTVIVRGTLDDTVIGDRVKVDDLVFIAHNVQVGDDTLIIANAEISGSVRIGRRVWVGPSATLINGISVGEGSFVGIGAVVTKDVATGVTVAGNPARLAGSRTRD